MEKMDYRCLAADLLFAPNRLRAYGQLCYYDAENACDLNHACGQKLARTFQQPGILTPDKPDISSEKKKESISSYITSV